MRELVIVIVFCSLGFLFFYATFPRNSDMKYNCDLAEISPDFPKEVKQKCRELRNEISNMQ